MTHLICLWRKRALFGLEIVISFCQPLTFSPSICCTHTPVLLPNGEPTAWFWGPVFPQLRGVPRMPLSSVSLQPPLRKAGSRVVSLLCHLQSHVSLQQQGISIQVSARFGDLHLQSLSLPLNGLHLLINNTCCLFPVKFYLINKYYYVSLC